MGRLLDMVIPSACYEMDTSLDGAWWVGAAAAVGKAPRVYPSLGGFFCAPPSNPFYCIGDVTVRLHLRRYSQFEDLKYHYQSAICIPRNESVLIVIPHIQKD